MAAKNHRLARCRHHRARGARLAAAAGGYGCGGKSDAFSNLLPLWRREGLAVPPRRSRKRIRNVSPPRPVTAEAPNAVWCLDFAEDRTLSGTKLRILCVTDEFTRESLAIEVGRCFRSERVCQVLEGMMNARGKPRALRMDNGPEFIALALKGLCHRRSIDPSYIEPGKPWQNGFAESFVSRLRDEFLDGEVFQCALEAQALLQ